MNGIAGGLQASATLGSGNFARTRSFYPRGPEGDPRLQPPKNEGGLFHAHKGIRKPSARLGFAERKHGVEVLFRAPDESGEGGCHAGACVFSTDSESFLGNEGMVEEVFGPSTLLVSELGGSLQVADSSKGN